MHWSKCSRKRIGISQIFWPSSDLEGAIRISTLMELARSSEITLPLQPNLHALVQMQPEENRNFSNFLAKFRSGGGYPYQHTDGAGALVRDHPSAAAQPACIGPNAAGRESEFLKFSGQVLNLAAVFPHAGDHPPYCIRGGSRRGSRSCPAPGIDLYSGCPQPGARLCPGRSDG